MWLIKKFLVCVFCCCKNCTEGNSDTLMVLKRRPSISVLSTCDNASKSWEFYIWLRKFPELLHFLKPAVQLDGCSAEELVRRPLHCVRVVFCKKRNLILQHLNLPPPFRIWWNPLHHFGRKYDEEFITYTGYLFQLYTAEKQVFCLSNKTFIMLWRVLQFYSQCQFVCAQWHANVHFISSILTSKQLFNFAST